MTSYLLSILALLLCTVSAVAQFDIRPSLPLERKNLSVNYDVFFEVRNVDPNLYVEDCTFQIFVNDGGTRRTLQSQSGTWWWMPVNVLALPQVPQPQLSVVLRVRHKYSGSAYSVSKVIPIIVLDSVFRISELDRVRYTYGDKLTPMIVGQEQGQVYLLHSYPQRTRSATLMQIGANGDTVHKVTVTGNPYLSSTGVLSDTVYSKQWPGAQRLRGHIVYDDGPAGGYTIERIIPDSIPAPVVEASAGFGPFGRGVDLNNVFTVKGMGPLCTAIEWSMQYTTDNGLIRVPVKQRRAYNAAADSSQFWYNMRDVSPRTRLIATAYYGDNLPPVQSTYDLPVTTGSPVFRISGSAPLVPGVDRADTVYIDSLPARILNVQMILTSGSGTDIRQVTTKREAPAYITSAKLAFNTKDLALGTYVVRVRALNDFKDDAPDYFFGIDIRDTSTFHLIADAWGPHTQGDSSTITPAITDIRPVVGSRPDKVLGHFTIVDSANPSIPIYASPFIDLSGVTSRDTVVHWPDETILLGNGRYAKAQLQTIDLPLSAEVRFERLIIRGSDTTRDNTLRHPIFMVPSPGTLRAVPPVDQPVIITRKSPIAITLSDVTPSASAVRFTLQSTKDPDPVAQQIITVPATERSVTWTVDAGLAPINSVIHIQPVTQLSNAIGASITRSINTVPDTLSMLAIPPIDTLKLDWDIDPATQMIRGVARFQPTLTFSRIPAQTRSIVIASYDEDGAVIDSSIIPVPYRTVYDSSLTVQTTFPFRSFSTTAIQVRYMSDGGPENGIQYTRPIVSLPPALGGIVRKIDLTKKPPQPDASPIRQGSYDVLDLGLRWRPNSPWAATTIGYNDALRIDSVRMDIVDCAGNILDSRLLKPVAPFTPTGVIVDTMYSVTALPLSTTEVRYRLYAKDFTLPRSGVLTTVPLRLRTNPRLWIPLGTTFPTYRVNDTTTATLDQQITITNLDGIYQIDSIRIVDKQGQTAHSFGSFRPLADTIRLAPYNMNNLRSANAPYSIVGLVRTRTCFEENTLQDTMVRINVPRVLADPATDNWVYSSRGWGPFQQGRAPITTVLMNMKPETFITTRADLSDSLEVTVIGTSRNVGQFSKSNTFTYAFKSGTSLPPSIRVRSEVNLNPFDTVSSIGVKVRWLQRNAAGVKVIADTLYSYPVRMLPFPDQPIDPDTANYEQSVLAGSFNTRLMPSYYDFGMKPQSASISSLRFTMLSTSAQVLDTTSIAPKSRNTADTTSVFAMQRDVAQYPWPYIARDREKVQIEIGYVFDGATVPTKIQKTHIEILPRAEWLNGSVATLDGTPTATSIPISVSIPMPSTAWTSTVPLFGDVRTAIVGKNNTPPDLVVKASYDPTSKQFVMRGSAPGGSAWIPSVSLFGAANYNANNIAADGKEEEEFEALYRFVKAPLADESDTIPNRELRIRSLYSASGKGVIGMLRWILEIKEKVQKLIKLGSTAATGGLVHLEPKFVIDGSAQQLSTINLGTEEHGALLHLNEAHHLDNKTEPNEFPTSQGSSLTLTGGGGLEASFLGLIGLTATVTNDYTLAAGSTFSNSVLNRRKTDYPTTFSTTVWANFELELFFGIISIELFRGKLYSYWQSNGIPSFEIFQEQWSSLFKVSTTNPKYLNQEGIRQLAKLPDETPYYRSAPSLSTSGTNVLTAHIEHSLLGSSGKLVLSAIDTATHTLRTRATVIENRNGIHDPTVTLVGGDGSALVAWLQNDLDASRAYGSKDYLSLLSGESIQLAFYNAATGQVDMLPAVADSSRAYLDGKPVIAVGPDSMSALIAWPAMETASSVSDVFVRRITRNGDTWQLGNAERIVRTPGVDRELSMVAMDDGSYVLSWINQDARSTARRIMAAVLQPDGTNSVSLLEQTTDSVLTSDAELVGNGVQAAVLIGKAQSIGDAAYSRSVDVYGYQFGQWSDASSLALGTGDGLIREIEAGLGRDGSFFAVVDGVGIDANGSSDHQVQAVVGSIYDQPSAWKVFTNDSSYTNPDHAIWSMSAAVGPKNVLYVATQELDTVRGNVQSYGAGTPIGPARLNTVLRAFRIDRNGELVFVPFGQSVNAVGDSDLDKLESDLRYRVKVLDPSPNPVREACVVPLWVQRPTTVDVRLVDALGNHVATVFTGSVEEGVQGVSFETSGIASGHYSVVVTDKLGVAGSVPVVIIR